MKLCNVNDKIIKHFIFLCSILESLFIYNYGTPRQGLEYLFLIPFTFAVCYVIFYQMIDYHKGGIGLKIFFVIIIFRYLVSPFLISFTGGFANPHMVNTSNTANSLAIYIICSELLLACITITFFWKRCLISARIKNEKINKNIKNGLSNIGIISLMILIFVVLIRSDKFIDSMNIMFFKTATSDIGSFEAIAINCLKAIFFVYSLEWTKRKYLISKNYMVILPVLFFLFLNIGIYFGSNRSFVLETALTSIFIYNYVFPKQKILIMFTIMPIAMLVISIMIFSKQFGLDITEINGFSIETGIISNIIENYVNGIWPMASIIDANQYADYNVSIFTPLRDFAEAFFIFRIPVFSWITETLLSDIPSTTDVYMNYLYPWSRGAMITLTGEMWMYGGNYFGWLFAIFANVFFVYLLVKMETLSRIVDNLPYKYMYIWMSVLCGLIMCYCAITIVWSWSKFILFYFIFLKINNSKVLKLL